jgi:hypothetical protein
MRPFDIRATIGRERNLAEEAEPQVEGTRQRTWLERLEEEHDNRRVALSWSLKRDDSELGLRMGSALGEFWYLREHFGEGLGWQEEALARSGRESTAARARALYRVPWLSCLQGNLDRAQEASEQGLVLKGVELFRTGGGDSVAAELRRTLRIAVSECGDFERATELPEESSPSPSAPSKTTSPRSSRSFPPTRFRISQAS